MAKANDLIQAIYDLADEVSYIGMIFNREKIKETKQDDELKKETDICYQLILKVDRLLVASNREDIEDDIDELNDAFAALTDAVSSTMASYIDAKKSLQKTKTYNALVSNLAILEQKKKELKEKTGLHILMFKPNIDDGRRLQTENLQSFLNDVFTQLNEIKQEA